ncbi:MAG: pyridoxal-dependent decarboxylase, exosortase A system-associated [Gammaproteobacteria bacterium]
MPWFKARGSDLLVNGVPLSRLAERVGRTPFYAYDRSLLEARIAHLRTVLPPQIELHYAVKANPMPAVVQHLRTLVDGFDVASQREMLVALDAGMAPALISFAGPGKTPAELRSAVAAGIVVNAESDTEIEHLARAGEALGITPAVAVRVNPDFELKGSGMKMTGSPRQFGIDADRVPQALKRIGELGLDFAGLHIFSGSQNLRADAILEANDKTFELAFRLAESAPGPLRMLNIGGGYGIPYFPGDRSLDLRPIGENLARWVPRVREALGSTAVVVELGRYIVGEAGIYVTRVVDRKVSKGQVFLVCDGGMHHHLANSGNFGQVIRKNYPVLIGNRCDAADRETVNVVGPLCTPLDILADRMDLPLAQVGDFVVVLQSGAYGLTASPRAFLSHPDALEVLV